jgi:hypothetical protein
MSTPSPRDPILTPSTSRQLKALWAPLWPGNRALWQAAWKDPEVLASWRTYLEAHDACLTLAPYVPETQGALLEEFAEGCLHELLATFDRQAPDVVSLFGRLLPYYLLAAADYHCTGFIPPWAPRKVWQPTPEIRIQLTAEREALGYRNAPRAHRRFVEKYLDMMDATGPGRPRGRGPTLEEMLTAPRQLKQNGHQVTQPSLIEPRPPITSAIPTWTASWLTGPAFASSGPMLPCARPGGHRCSPSHLRPAGEPERVCRDAYREAGLNFTRVHSGVTSSKMASSGMSTSTASSSHCTTLDTIRGPSSSCTTA